MQVPGSWVAGPEQGWGGNHIKKKTRPCLSFSGSCVCGAPPPPLPSGFPGNSSTGDPGDNRDSSRSHSAHPTAGTLADTVDTLTHLTLPAALWGRCPRACPLQMKKQDKGGHACRWHEASSRRVGIVPAPCTSGRPLPLLTAALSLGLGPGVPIHLQGTCEPCVLMGTSGLGGAGPARLCSLEAPVSSSASRVSEAEQAGVPAATEALTAPRAVGGAQGPLRGPGGLPVLPGLTIPPPSPRTRWPAPACCREARVLVAVILLAGKGAKGIFDHRWLLSACSL